MKDEKSFFEKIWDIITYPATRIWRWLTSTAEGPKIIGTSKRKENFFSIPDDLRAQINGFPDLPEDLCSHLEEHFQTRAKYLKHDRNAVSNLKSDWELILNTARAAALNLKPEVIDKTKILNRIIDQKDFYNVIHEYVRNYSLKQQAIKFDRAFVALKSNSDPINRYLKKITWSFQSSQAEEIKINAQVKLISEDLEKYKTKKSVV